MSTVLQEPTQDQIVSTILNTMVTQVKDAAKTYETIKKDLILAAAEDLEHTGVAVDSICFLIIKRSEEMDVSDRYIYKILPNKFKNQSMSKNASAGCTSAANMKTVNVDKKDDIKLATDQTSSPVVESDWRNKYSGDCSTKERFLKGLDQFLAQHPNNALLKYKIEFIGVRQ